MTNVNDPICYPNIVYLLLFRRFKNNNCKSRTRFLHHFIVLSQKIKLAQNLTISKATFYQHFAYVLLRFEMFSNALCCFKYV